MKVRHDPTNIIPPRAKLAAVAVAVAIAAGSATPVVNVAKARHDGVVWQPTHLK